MNLKTHADPLETRGPLLKDEARRRRHGGAEWMTCLLCQGRGTAGKDLARVFNGQEQRCPCCRGRGGVRIGPMRLLLDALFAGVIDVAMMTRL